MPDYYLKEAYDLLLKEYKGPDEIEYNGGYKCKVYRQISSEMVRWYFQTRPMLDINYWNLGNLTNEYGRIRKPRIFTQLYLTTKRNLVLDW